jgi:hypothetical protein
MDARSAARKAGGENRGREGADRDICVRAWFLPSCYECTETMWIKQLFEQLDPVGRSVWFLCIHSTMVKTTLPQMSFHDRGFNSRDGFDSQSSWVPVLSYDRGNDGTCQYIRNIKMCLARSNMRAHGHYGSSHPGLPSPFGPAARCPGVLRN